MATFISRLSPSGTGPTLAVKDLIDVAGSVTTAGSRAVESVATPSEADAPLLAGARARGARIVGKANLYELAFGASGVNPFYGTPRNPLDPACIPGGSSSGSAVAVADGDAEVAYGSDTGGSIRVPAAFCGVTGLKTTHGRIGLRGVYALAPSLDTVGPMARDVAGIALGMALLEPGFQPGRRATVVGRLRPEDVAVDPVIDEAIDRVLGASELEVAEVRIDHWMQAYHAGSDILSSEAVASNMGLLSDEHLASLLSVQVARRLDEGRRLGAHRVEEARRFQDRWREELLALFEETELLALPSVGFFPPPLEEAFEHVYTHLTMPFNLSGFPAISLPVATRGRFPASLQIVGPPGSEEMLVATAGLFEACAA